MNTFIRIWALVTFQKLVWLQDFDGEVVLRPAKKDGFGYYSKRLWPFNIRNVRLNDDGSISPDCYVKRWKEA